MDQIVDFFKGLFDTDKWPARWHWGKWSDRKTNSELETEIVKRKEAEQQLSEANQNMEAFASMASHDLQEPLRKIMTYTSILQEGNGELTIERTNELLDKITACSIRMQNMTKDILSLSSVMKSAEFGKVSVNDAVALALEDLEFKIKEKNAVFEIELMPDVIGNQAYLSQVFANLIGNAIKFSRERPVISITSETRERTVIIYVKDNGIGIDSEHTEKIFAAFHRLHGKNEYEGSGLGLAICKRIMDLHKGNIRAESIPGVGTTFIIELPKA